MSTHHESLTAVEVIRFVYLARMAAKRGDREAAQRWQAKADTWLGRTQAGPRRLACTTPLQTSI